MSRAVKEWCGRTDDAKPPPRVRLRIFQRENGVCYLSGRKITPADAWELDHKIALINGGKNEESNLFPVLADKHKEKTRADIAEKSHVADRAKSNLGIRGRPVQKVPGDPDALKAKRRPKHEGRPSLPPRVLFVPK